MIHFKLSHIIYYQVVALQKVIYVEPSDNNFMDLMVFCSDGYVSYQCAVDKYEVLGVDDEWILINNDFILDTTAMFTGGYDIAESILSYVSGTVLTKYGLGEAPCVNIDTTYHGEHELGEKVVPVLMIRLTAPVAMELSK